MLEFRVRARLRFNVMARVRDYWGTKRLGTKRLGLRNVRKRAVRIQHFSAQAFCRLFLRVLDCICWIDTLGTSNSVVLVQNESSKRVRAAARSRSTPCVVGHRRKMYHLYASRCQTPSVADYGYQILSHCVVPLPHTETRPSGRSFAAGGPRVWNMLHLVANYTRSRGMLS